MAIVEYIHLKEKKLVEVETAEDISFRIKDYIELSDNVKEALNYEKDALVEAINVIIEKDGRISVWLD